MLHLIPVLVSECKISKKESFRVPLFIWIYSRLTPYIFGLFALFCVVIRFFNKWINCHTRDHLDMHMAEIACIFEMSYRVPIEPFTRYDVYYGVHSMNSIPKSEYQYYKVYLYIVPLILIKVRMLSNNPQLMKLFQLLIFQLPILIWNKCKHLEDFISAKNRETDFAFFAEKDTRSVAHFMKHRIGNLDLTLATIHVVALLSLAFVIYLFENLFDGHRFLFYGIDLIKYHFSSKATNETIDPRHVVCRCSNE